MVTVVTIKVEGLQQLEQRLKQLSEKVARKAASRATSAAAAIVKKAAKTKIRSNPSIETGTLLDAVIMKKLGKSQSRLTSEHIVTVRQARRGGKKTKTKQATAPYAHFVEFGTVKMTPEPFLRPAIDQNVGACINAMRDRLKEEIEKGGA